MKIRGLLAGGAWRSVKEKVSPQNRVDVCTLGDPSGLLVADEDRSELRVAANELSESFEIGGRDPTGLHLDGPRAPAPFEHPIHFEGFLSPVAHVLARVPGMGEACVLYPNTPTLGISAAVRDASGICDREQGVVERYELWGRSVSVSRVSSKLRR